jgi:flagellar biosynthesis/type III secretory pathway chaperone
MTSGDFQPLHALLLAERESVRLLAGCLKQERQALAELDGPALEAIAGIKQQLLQRMERQARERVVLAEAAGHDGETMEGFIEAADREGVLADCWQGLLADLRTCRHQNRVNGGVIELGRQGLHTALGLLRGQQAVPRSTTYQANGRTPTPLDHRALGTA